MVGVIGSKAASSVKRGPERGAFPARTAATEMHTSLDEGDIFPEGGQFGDAPRQIVLNTAKDSCSTSDLTRPD